MALARETVIATALDLLDQAGLDNLTMRRLADALQVKAASLYWHFANKQALMDAMADALMAQVAQAAPSTGHASEDPLTAVAAVAHEIRGALLARKDGARVYAGTYVVTENVMRVAEAMIGPLRQAGASTRLACWSSFALLDYVLGFVMEEQGSPSINPKESALTEQRVAFAALAAPSYPHVAAAMDDVFHLDFDARFTTGLDLFIAGLRVKLEKTSVV
ncbi:MAG: TetR/AcrR family transcriptional regulator C-terminal domain-containing protein [Rhodanobacter sp.]